MFFLIWAAIFLTWTPVDTLHLVPGITFVPIGLAVIFKCLIARRPSNLQHSMASADED